MAALLCAVTFISCVNEKTVLETKTNSSLPSGLKVYQTEELLRNGDYQQKQFSVDLPLFWLPTYNSTIPEKRNLYSLTDGVLTMKAPFDIWQFNDITPEASMEYVLAFKSKVIAGSLRCNVFYRSYNNYPNSLRGELLNQKIPVGKDFEKHEYTLKFDPKYTSGFLAVSFVVSGNQGEVKLGDISIRPIPPKTILDAKQIYLDAGGGKTVLRGIAVSDKRSFYELQAAKYLQKYLFVGFGRYIDIFIADKAAGEYKKGLVLIGNDFIDNSAQSEIKTGGYAVLSGNGNLRIGGKEDGAIQGAFAVLSNLGMDFYTLLDFSKPSSEVIKFAAKTVKNPAFGYRYIDVGSVFVSSCALGESSLQLINDIMYIGSWNGMTGVHPLGTLIDPFLYFKDHPEYFALNPTLKCRTWKAAANHINSKMPEVEYCGYMQICYSNPEVQGIVAGNVLKWFDACPQMAVCHLYFGDRNGPSNWCQCENCRKFGDNDTDRWLKFINIIAREVKKKYPDKLIATGCYAEMKARPVKEQTESNVVPEYIVSQDGWACKNHFDCAKNRDAGWVENVSDWLKDYPGRKFVGFYPAGQPAGVIRPFAGKMKYFAEHGVSGSFWYGSEALGNDPLLKYVVNKLAWDPCQNPDALVTEFVNFYYGPAAPYVKQYVDMIEKCDEARAAHSKDLPPSIVDYKFLTEGEKLLGQAIALTDDSKKKERLRRDLLQLLALYVSNNNKSTGLRGERLQAFAKTFAEFLEMSRDFKIIEPAWLTSYRKFIQKVALLDIGDTDPWYDSPVVRKIFEDPVGTIGKEEKAYLKTPQGLDFKLELCCGGEPLIDQAAPSGSKRAFTRVLRRASSSASVINCAFDLEKAPEKGAFIELEGLDCEKPDRAGILIRVNDKGGICGYVNDFSKTDWTTARYAIPPGVLKDGANSLVISNITPDKPDEHLDETVGGITTKDYFWGWLMISKAKLVFSAAK